jgi:hypothetical protein
MIRAASSTMKTMLVIERGPLATKTASFDGGEAMARV